MTWNGKPVDWRNVAYFSAIHLGALAAPWTFTWTGFGLFLFFYWFTGSVGVCMTYHRLLTHRSFRVPKLLEYALTIPAMLASEGGAVAWVAMHRIHHAQSDRPGKDLHTPQDGFWWSHFGWVICEVGMDRRALERRYAPELAADPFHRVMNRLHMLPTILLAAGLYAWGGWSYVVWGVCLRTVVLLHSTWAVNSAAHSWGYRTYSTPEGSRNLWWVGLAAWGEGWHNNHHAFQRSARHGLRWWELDLTWWLIRGLAAVGLARDVKLIPENAEQFRIERDAPEFARPAAEPAI